MRAIFFEEDDAEQVAARLRRDGFDASVERERLAGEDDDEDHPWAVVSDAPEFVLEVLVDEHDGWLDVEASAPSPATPPAPPLDLPRAPRRVKRPDLLPDAPDALPGSSGEGERADGRRGPSN